MGGHRREISDSHLPLRPSEIQATFDAQELQVRVESPPIIESSRRSNCNGEIGHHSFLNDVHSDTAVPKKTLNGNNRSLATELLKTGVAFFCLSVSAFLNFFLLTIIHDIVPQEPLPDLVFRVIHQHRWAWAVGDVLSTINSIVGFTVVMLHRERIVVLRRVFLLAAILYGLRAVVMGVTYLPPSFDHRAEICEPKINSTMYFSSITKRFVTYVVTLGLTSGQPQILCGDLMFSGHTVVLTIMYFTQLQYTPRGLVLLRYIAAPITFLGIAALVISGGHYTMDVLIAYWLTSHVFWSYHQVFEMPLHQRSEAPLARIWWFWLCWWFEADVPPGKMRNDWNWPFPKPAIAHSIMAKLNAKLQ